MLKTFQFLFGSLADFNGQDSFTFSPGTNSIATLTYSSSQTAQLPPPRKVYSLTDPVAYEATSRTDAAMAILAKYGAAKWEMADGYTDFVQGAPASDGQAVRAIADSGYASDAGNYRMVPIGVVLASRRWR